MIRNLFKKKRSVKLLIDYVLFQIFSDLEKDWDSIMRQIENITDENGEHALQKKYLAIVIASELIVVRNLTPEFLPNVITRLNETLSEMDELDLVGLSIMYLDMMILDIKEGNLPYDSVMNEVFGDIYDGKNENIFPFFSLTLQSAVVYRRTFWKDLSETYRLVK